MELYYYGFGITKSSIFEFAKSLTYKISELTKTVAIAIIS